MIIAVITEGEIFWNETDPITISPSQCSSNKHKDMNIMYLIITITQSPTTHLQPSLQWKRF